MRKKLRGEKKEDKVPERFNEAIRNVVQWIAAENISLAILDDLFSPRPTSLSTSAEDAIQLEKRMSRIIQRFGGPPRIAIRANDGSDDKQPEVVDEYPGAALAELVNMFHRTRRRVAATPRHRPL